MSLPMSSSLEKQSNAARRIPARQSRAMTTPKLLVHRVLTAARPLHGRSCPAAASVRSQPLGLCSRGRALIAEPVWLPPCQVLK